jgi:hypothetical protein
MTYVPIVSHVPTPDASTEARLLAREIEDLVIAFQRDHPHTRPEDVRQAMNIVSLGSDGRPASTKAATLAVAVGLLVAGLLGFALLWFRAG